MKNLHSCKCCKHFDNSIIQLPCINCNMVNENNTHERHRNSKFLFEWKKETEIKTGEIK